jgi:hypothetical protein
MGAQRAPHKQGLPEEKDIAIKLLRSAGAVLFRGHKRKSGPEAAFPISYWT